MEATEPLLSPITLDGFTPQQKSMFLCAAQRWIQKLPFESVSFKFPIVLETDLHTRDVVHGINEAYSEITTGFFKDIDLRIQKRDTDRMQIWCKSIGTYLNQLPFPKKFTLLGYTRFGDVFANSLLRGIFDEAKFQEALNEWQADCAFHWQHIEHDAVIIRDLEVFFPLYYQALQALETFYNKSYNTRRKGAVAKIPRMNATANVKSNANIPTNLRHKIETMVTQLKGVKRYIYFGSALASELPIQTFWIPVIHRFIADLKDIVQGCPPLPCDLRLFRGIKPDGYQPQRQTYRVTGFLSTTSRIGIAKAFMDVNKFCCIQEITVSKGVRTLPMAGLSFFPHENEFLFGSNTILYVSSATDQKNVLKVALVQ